MKTFIIENPITGEVSECYLSHYEKGRVLSFKDIETHEIIMCVSNAETITFPLTEKAYLEVAETGGEINILKYIAESCGLSVDNYKLLLALKVETGDVKASSEEELIAKCSTVN